MTKRLKMIVLRTMIYLKKKDQTGNVDSKISEASNVRKSMAGDELRNLTLFSVGVFCSSKIIKNALCSRFHKNRAKSQKIVWDLAIVH